MAIEGHQRANRPGPEPMTLEELGEMIEANPPTHSVKRKPNGK